MITEDIRMRLITFLSETFPLFDPTRPEDAPLEAVLDSMGITELIQYIEGEWPVRILDADLTRRNLGSVAAIVSFIKGKLSLRPVA